MTDSILLRSIRHVSSLALDTVEELIEAEFRSSKTGLIDLDLSVYLVTSEEVTRARTEHRASFANPPDESQGSASLDGFHDFDVEKSPGGTSFAFTVEQHRTLKLVDLDDLKVLVEALINEPSRRRTTSLDDMREYVSARLSAGDQEWDSLCARKNRKQWRRFATEKQSTEGGPPDSPGVPPPDSPGVRKVVEQLDLLGLASHEMCGEAEILDGTDAGDKP